jgi:hypothetical protein
MDALAEEAFRSAETPERVAGMHDGISTSNDFEQRRQLTNYPT